LVKKLVQNAEFIDESGILDDAIKICKVVKNLELIGETGTGKTLLGHTLADHFRLPLFEHTLSIDANRWELIASDVLEKGETKVRDGIVLMWLKEKKGVLLINGFNYAPANVISLFESLADWTNKIYVSELQQEFVRSEEHYLIVTMNPYQKVGYAGTHQMNIATMRRFEPINVHYLSAMKETELLMKHYNDYDWVRKLVEFANKTRILYREGKLTMPLTTGNLINYAGLKAMDMSDARIISIACAHYLDEERPTVKRLWEETEEAEGSKRGK
jgi:MoxR-like ATPase